MRVRIYSHGFVVDKLSITAQKACFAMANQLVQFGFMPQAGRMVRKALKVYACTTPTKDEFRFLIGHLNKFKRILQTFSISENLVDFETVGFYKPAKCKLKLGEKWVLRDYQEPIVEFLARKTSKDYTEDPSKWKPVRSLLPLQTGQGKGLCSMSAVTKMGWRAVFLVRPMFHDKWLLELCDTYNIEMKDVYLVQGTKSLLKLLKMASTVKGKASIPDIILFSNKTYQMWLKSHEKLGLIGTKKLGYSCPIGDFYEYVQAGVRIIDEAHMDFHLCCKSDMYTHVPISISLTATLIGRDPFLSKMYWDVYPKEERYNAPPLIKYIDAYAVAFQFRNPDKIRVNEWGSTNFSNNQVELSILRDKKTTDTYMQLIASMVDYGYVNHPREKKKMAIFAYSTLMIDTIVEYLRKRYPQYDTKRYMSEDDYVENLINSDIVVSTSGSMGTGQDVKNLVCVLCTIAISSEQLNVQILGRLRDLKDGSEMRYLYLVPNLLKPLQYWKEKQELFKPRVKSHHLINSPIMVG